MAVMVPGLRVSAMGLGKIVSKLSWLLRKLAGPTNVKTGLAPGVKRRSSLEMILVVVAGCACRGEVNLSMLPSSWGNCK